MTPRELAKARAFKKQLMEAPREPSRPVALRKQILAAHPPKLKGPRMKTIDIPEQQIGLGPVKSPAPAPVVPKQVAEGIMRGPDGKLFTDIKPIQPVVIQGYWFPMPANQK